MIEKLIASYDEDKKIFHLSASEPIIVNTPDELDELCCTVSAAIGNYVDSGRCYMIVDLAKFLIDTKLHELYAKKIMGIAEKYIFPKGLARYGYQITRTTIQMGYKKIVENDPNLFRTKKEAFEYIKSLIKLDSPDSISDKKPVTTGAETAIIRQFWDE